MISLQNQDEIAETLLIPLYFRSLESMRPDGLIRDERSIRLVEQIDYDFRKLKLPAHDSAAIIIRLLKFDELVRTFLHRNPHGVVVHIGCGLDTRFERVDNGTVEWFDLDLPEVMAIRLKWIGDPKGRAHSVAASVFETGWLEEIKNHAAGNLLFVAEGVFPYFKEEDLKVLFLRLMREFPGCELVCDAHTPFAIWTDNLSLVFSKIRARLRWGLKHPEDVERWGHEGTLEKREISADKNKNQPEPARIHLLEKWYYFEKPEPRMRSVQWMRFIPLFGKSTGIFHYRLGERKTG